MSIRQRQALPALVIRLRKDLWRERIWQGVLAGSRVSALVLLVLGACQIWLFPVAFRYWLPLGLAPLLLGAAQAMLWRRPSAAQAAALFDRHVGCGELLLSGWEAHTTLPANRSAGAAAVLGAAEAWARSVPIPRDWPSRQNAALWYNAYPTVTWILLAVGLFLLQLSGTPVARLVAEEPEANPANSSAATSQGLPWPHADRTPVQADTVSGSGPINSTVPSTGQPAPGEFNDGASAPTEPPRLFPASGPHQVGQGPGAGAAENTAGAAGASAGRDAARASLATGGGLTAADTAGTVRVGDADAPLPQINYADIARQIAGQVTAITAGDGAVPLDPATSMTSGTAGATTRIERQSLALPYATRFSSAERAQINSYFEHIEALP